MKNNLNEYYKGREFLDKISKLFKYYTNKQIRYREFAIVNPFHTPQEYVRAIKYYQDKLDRITQLRKSWQQRHIIQQ